MEYIENTDTQSVGKFTKKFIENYILAAILTGVVVIFISEIVALFLPTELLPIANFLLIMFGFWKISSFAVEKSLKEVNINSDNTNKVLKKIFVFPIALLVINILFACMSFINAIIIAPSLVHIFTINFIIDIVARTIQYAIVMLLCKSKLEEKALGKKINKTLYVIFLIISVIILCLSMLFDNYIKTNYNVNDTTNIKNLAIENKYPNAKWVEVGHSASANVDSDRARVNVSLGHLKQGTVEKYKVVKIICTIYNEETNKVYGISERYYEDVELKYGYNSFDRTIIVNLSTFLLGEWSPEITVYGIPE